MKRFGEFFQNDEGRYSMTRLLCFLSFFPASYILIKTRDAEIFGWYLSAYVISYVGGKVSDIIKAPKTVVAENAKSVSVETQQGDINVASR